MAQNALHRFPEPKALSSDVLFWSKTHVQRSRANLDSMEGQGTRATEYSVHLIKMNAEN